MNRTERILAATDLSAPARHAVDRARRLAALSAAELEIVHVLELDALDTLRDLLGANLSAPKAALEADARARLAQLAREGATPPGVDARMRVVAGTPLAVIAREADALGAGLLVLGARGESFLRHAALGSTAERLLRKAVGRPVLVVKRPPHDDYRHVLVAVDFSPASRMAIREAMRWAPGAELVLLHAFELPFEGKLRFAGVDDHVIRQYVATGLEARKARLQEFAASAGLSPENALTRVIHGDPSQQIVAMEQEYDVDLVVVGKHGTRLSEELLLGSVTKRVLDDAQGDVLVVADPRPGTVDLP